ncbi:30S ribosomal protein S14 type Z [Nanobdella aerobiophila]|uniref:Small ribosomal subunit protein uS14 n=1 Tax=Nanobdella aerobiophila TaxID=2586965 RepID=A0A915SLE8_9ARCH|nr:30S ribosomal protein S14 [Nanobdella aerobiophila]BBL45916.1 30S ribosomal protein S14 type Z [Nanobdella aerobiophila]
MPNSWSYLVELQRNKKGTLTKIIKSNSPKYVREEIRKLIKEGKIKNIEELVNKSIQENKTIIEVLKEYGIENKERKFGKGSVRCIICNSHDRVIRRYNIYICGRCFREMAKTMGFRVSGE